MLDTLTFTSVHTILGAHAWSMLFSGSCICSNRVLATCAIHNLKGSALGEGMDCIRRNSCSVSATSVRRSLPSAARNFKRLQVVTVWLPSFINLYFYLDTNFHERSK